MKTKSRMYGFSEWNYLVEQINKDFGVANTRENVLVPAARNAMKLVLQAARDKLVPGHGLDTGQLKRTLSVGARATTKRDWRSRYVSAGDIVVATVSAKLNKKFVGGVNVGDASDARAIATEFGTKNKNENIAKQKGMSKKGHLALQREFGTVRLPPRPYLRPALEQNQAAVSQKLGEEIARLLAKYKSTVVNGK